VTRTFAAGLVLVALAFAPSVVFAQDKREDKRHEPAEPPEEDEILKPKEYVFNPLQAQKELNIGNFYFKKGSWKAASLRYTEATLWNPGFADAWLRLGEAREKMKDADGARLAYKKFLELAPEDKRAGEVKKKLSSAK
jgi:tetratricopeptide (TPR) repeat protein